ncbi:nitrilase family protein [Gimesia fumaroli]|uniref:(R)-stereoselective amidase n=1 Tax=Gimesia fumaroli TaxID=2527976 RepID=A0A518IEV5_9PLAN|nr:nitrilase family protein [Gimesia fumaroli]QDV51614.1 (R)-stereoselective amidase [Gimesia fumaroli]
MRDIRIAAVQFEHRNGDKAYNLQRIRELAHQAVEQGAEIVSFHECCIPAYTFVQSFSKEQLIDLAEPVPNGPSTQELMQISGEVGVPILAGLFEVDQGEVYNTYVCVDGTELLARFRKLHAFVNSHLSSGDEYVVFDVRGCRCGILICYDNNLVENVRMTAMLGADIIFMPHVTCCLPSLMPGRGLVDPALWHNRDRDPVRLRQEFQGPKGKGWLMRWLPARAYDNGVYAIFTNPVGMDDQEVKPGLSMILDPFGEIIAECTKLGDDIAIALCTEEKLGQAGGRRYIRARRPDLYGKLVEPSETPPVTEPGWELKPSS